MSVWPSGCHGWPFTFYGSDNSIGHAEAHMDLRAAAKGIRDSAMPMRE